MKLTSLIYVFLYPVEKYEKKKKKNEETKLMLSLLNMFEYA